MKSTVETRTQLLTRAIRQGMLAEFEEAKNSKQPVRVGESLLALTSVASYILDRLAARAPEYPELRAYEFVYTKELSDQITRAHNQGIDVIPFLSVMMRGVVTLINSLAVSADKLANTGGKGIEHSDL